MKQPLTVLVYAVHRTSDGWEYLLLRRTPQCDGFWQGVSGTVEPGESLEEAARRELQEETGFVAELERIDYSYSFPIADKWRHEYAPDVKEIMEHVFIAFLSPEATSEPQIDPREHDRWAWCRFAEALKRLTWPENIDALKRCEDVLLRRFSVECMVRRVPWD
jgi:dATP pyrophosphohydrolase